MTDTSFNVRGFGQLLDFRRGYAEVVRHIDSINRVDEEGNPYVRIHAIGFPMPAALGQTAASVGRFANLMRILCERNGGTFVGLSRRAGT